MIFAGNDAVFEPSSPLDAFLRRTDRYGFSVTFGDYLGEKKKGFSSLYGVTDQTQVTIEMIGQILALNANSQYQVDVFDYPFVAKVDLNAEVPEGVPNRHPAIADDESNLGETRTWQEWCEATGTTPLSVGEEMWVPVKSERTIQKKRKRYYIPASIWIGWPALGIEVKSLADFHSYQTEAPSE